VLEFYLHLTTGKERDLLLIAKNMLGKIGAVQELLRIVAGAPWSRFAHVRVFYASLEKSLKMAFQ
jgi:hypothetical protein